MRNSTGGVLALRIYDASEQQGDHPCSHNKGGCEQLCLPNSPSTYTCACAIGYIKDTKNATKCIAKKEFLFYSLNWELSGIPLYGKNDTQVLGPISKISSATAIDFLADQDLLFWADSDHGTICRIKRDGTKRKYILEQSEVLDNAPIDWLTGFAIDWIAGNVYWCDSKRGTIEVSKIDGTKQHVLMPYEIGKPNTIAVDPIRGYLVWAGGSKMEIATMDGQNRRVLVDNRGSITDVVMDSDKKFVYFCDAVTNTIERIDYDGKESVVLLSQNLENPVALTLWGDKIYWLDR